MRELAPGKLNVSLYVGRPRPDGYHPLASVMQAVTLCDELRLEPGGGADEVVCPGLEGPNIVADAIAAFRAATGWEGPPVRIRIEKRLPVAAGMGGGSADAAAALRLLSKIGGRPDHDVLLGIAAELGADVPSQLRPGRVLATGIGDVVEPLRPVVENYVVAPSPHKLSTPAVYAEFDRLGLGRHELPEGASPLFVNDLQPAAISLCPSIEDSLEALRAAGATHALVSGSGPTTFGVFPSREAAEGAAARIRGAIPTEPFLE